MMEWYKTITSGGGGFKPVKRYVDKMQNNMVSTLFFDWLSVWNLLDATLDASMLMDFIEMYTRKIVVGYLLRQRWCSLNLKIVIEDIKATIWLAIRGSWARIGRYQDNNCCKVCCGTHAGERVSSIRQPVMSSYYGYATIARIYNTTWVGYGLGWPYSDKWNIGLNTSFSTNVFLWT